MERTLKKKLGIVALCTLLLGGSLYYFFNRDRPYHKELKKISKEVIMEKDKRDSLKQKVQNELNNLTLESSYDLFFSDCESGLPIEIKEKYFEKLGYYDSMAQELIQADIPFIEKDIFKVRSVSLRENNSIAHVIDKKGRYLQFEYDDGLVKTCDFRQDSELLEIINKYYTIQIIAGFDEEKVSGIFSKLKDKGYDVFRDVTKSGYHRIGIGSYEDKETALEEAKKLKEESVINDFWVRKLK